MTDGLYSMIVCNDSMVQPSNSYSYRSYELLTVQVRVHLLSKLHQTLSSARLLSSRTSDMQGVTLQSVLPHVIRLTSIRTRQL